MEETNVILKYHREKNIWVCPECEAENELKDGLCSVCGYDCQGGDIVVIKSWTEFFGKERTLTQEEINNLPPDGEVVFVEPHDAPEKEEKIRDYDSTTHYHRVVYDPPVEDETDLSKVVMWSIAIIAVVVFVIFIITSSSNMQGGLQ